MEQYTSNDGGSAQCQQDGAEFLEGLLGGDNNCRKRSPSHFPMEIGEVGSIFGNIRSRRVLHGVITGNHRWRGERLERELYKFAMDFNFEGKKQSGIIALHATKWASHVHWVHLCGNYHKDCHCEAVRQIRRKHCLSVKWKHINWSASWERNCFLYLQKPGRTTLKVFVEGKNQLGQWLQNGAAYAGDNRSGSENPFRCELDDGDGEKQGIGTSGLGVGEGSGEGEASSVRSWGTGRDRPGNHKQAAVELDGLLRRKFHPSKQALLTDSEYQEIMEEYYYVMDEKRKRITDQVWENFLIDWNNKSLEEIVMARKNTVFNSRHYYSPKYSVKILWKLLSNQVGNPRDFLDQLINIFNMKAPKVNTMYIRGAAGAGKTYFFNSLADLAWSVGYVDTHINRYNVFPFENLLYKRMAIFNEFNVVGGQVDMVKEIFEGNKTMINKKYQDKCCLERIPIFITTNNDFLQNLDNVNKEAYRQRMIIYKWQTQPWLKLLDAYPHPLAWAKLLYSKGEEEPDLENPEYDTSNETDIIDLSQVEENFKDMFD